MQLTHIRLLVNDLPACFRFYNDVLALPCSFGGDDAPYASFTVGGAEIALFSRGDMASAVGAGALAADAPAQDRAVIVIAVDDVDAACRGVAERGGAFVNPPHDRPTWGVRCAHLRDPEGNLIELNRENAG